MSSEDKELDELEEKIRIIQDANSAAAESPAPLKNKSRRKTASSWYLIPSILAGAFGIFAVYQYYLAYDQIRGINASRIQADERIKEQEERYKELQTDRALAETYRKERLDLEGKIEALQKAVDTAEAIVTDGKKAKADFDTLNIKINESNDVLARNKKTLNELMKDIAERRTEKEQLFKIIAELKPEKSALEKVIVNLDDQKRELEGKLTKIIASMPEKIEQEKELDSNLATLQENLKNAEDRLTNTQNELTSTKKTLDDEIAKLEQHKKVTAELPKLREEETELTAKTEQLKKESNAIQLEKVKLETQKTQLAEVIDEQTSRKTKLKEEIRTLDQELNVKLKSEIAALQNQKELLHDSLAALRTQFSSLAKDMQEISSSPKSPKVSNAQEKISRPENPSLERGINGPPINELSNELHQKGERQEEVQPE